MRATQALQNIAAQVRVDVENTSWNSRKLFATVDVQAPVDLLWSSLTDYEHLGDFIPSLVENRCLQKKDSGAVVYQVGAQDVAMGVKFKAACTLDCTEYMSGVPAYLCSCSGNGADGLFPQPKLSAEHAPVRDITFSLVEGDFKAFRGVWRMMPAGDMRSILCYSLYVMPQAWLPVNFIQGRIEQEVKQNLAAVRKYAESLSRKQHRHT